jgi:arginase family enzyme
VKTTAVFFPFDLFGSAGTSAGALLLADAFREMLADNRREKTLTRAPVYGGDVRVRELRFETPESYSDWRKKSRALVRRLLDREDFFFWVTGNHLGVLPVYEELSLVGNSLIVQFDAHLDIHNFSDCTQQLSHGNFLLHATEPLPDIINIGNRDLLLTSDYVAKHYRTTVSAELLCRDEGKALAPIIQRVREAPRVVLDIDCDVLDPTCFPAVTHPVPFGLTPLTLLRLLDTIWSDRVAGVAISEFYPGRDRDDQCLATLAWLAEHLLLKRYEKA